MSEESMNSEERVKLIKWGCKYTEGWNFHSLPHGNFLEYQDYSWNIETQPCSNIMYPLFLQQVIEGWNQANRKVRYLSQDDLGIDVVVHNGHKIEETFCFYEFRTITEAKESALRYIMDQEGSND